MAAVGWAHEHDGLALARHPHGRHVAQKHAQLHQRQRVRQDGLCAATLFEYEFNLNINIITSCGFYLIDPQQAARSDISMSLRSLTINGSQSGVCNPCCAEERRGRIYTIIAREAGQELDNQAMPESKSIKASGNSG